MPSPDTLKRKLDSAAAREDSLMKKLRNATDRQKHSKVTCKRVTDELHQLHVINDELKLKLKSYSGMCSQVICSSAVIYYVAGLWHSVSVHPLPVTSIFC